MVELDESVSGSEYIWGFLKWWYPTTMGFPTKNDYFGMFWGYHHLRKHPYVTNNVTLHQKTLFFLVVLFFRWIIYVHIYVFILSYMDDMIGAWFCLTLLNR